MAQKPNPASDHAPAPLPSGERDRDGLAFPPEPTTTAAAWDEEQLPPKPPAEITGWLESGLAVLDASGRVTEINEALSGWLDRPAATIVGQFFWELFAEHCAHQADHARALWTLLVLSEWLDWVAEETRGEA